MGKSGKKESYSGPCAKSFKECVMFDKNHSHKKCLLRVATKEATKHARKMSRLPDTCGFTTVKSGLKSRRLASLPLAPVPELTTTSLIGPICGICLAIALLTTRFASRITCRKAHRKDNHE